MIKKLFFVLLFVGFITSTNAQNDSIRLSNGDEIVGLFKTMEEAVLIIKTKYSNSDFNIKWPQVTEFKSDRTFIIYLSDGQRLESKIYHNPENKNEVFLYYKNRKIITTLENIVFIDRSNQNFFRKLHIEVDAGISLRKAQDYQEYSGNLILSYLTQKWNYASSLNMVFSSQEDTEDISRYESKFSAQRFFKNDWFFIATIDLYSNTDQNLKLRNTENVGGGYYFVNTNKSKFGSGIGLGFNNETYFNSDGIDKNSLESFLQVEYVKYSVGSKFSMNSSMIATPSITEKGRVRVNLNASTKYKFTPKLYIKMGLSYNYDNQPSEFASKGDYTFQTTFGWDNN